MTSLINSNKTSLVNQRSGKPITKPTPPANIEEMRKRIQSAVGQNFGGHRIGGR